MDTATGRARAIAAATRLSRVLRAAWTGEDMDGTGDLVDALRDAARILGEHGVPYALIGGFAVGMHATPRATVDVDFAVRTSDRERAVAALTEAGFTVRGTYAHSTNFRHPNGAPVQLAFDDALDPMIDRAAELDVSGVAVRVLTKPDLIASKERAANDPARRRSKAMQDLVDVEVLRGDVSDPDEGW